MPSTVAEDIIQGMDAVVQLTGPGGPITVGGFQAVSVTLRNTMVPYAELNEQWDLMLPGKMSASGTASRGWQDVNAIASLLGGQTTVGRGIRTKPPKFTMTLTVTAPGKAADGKRLQLLGCSFSQMTWNARSAEAAVDNGIDFSAEGFAWL